MAVQTQSPKAPLGRQPRGLYVLFMTEFWEKYGFVTMASLLVLYGTQKLSMTDSRANLLIGSFMGLIYATTVAGGILADRLLGFRIAISLGAAIMATGYCIMALGAETVLYVGLAFVIVGSGLFKPNVASLLGSLYEKDDPRRDSGFLIFYMGTNIGSILALLVAAFGYWLAFLLAGAASWSH